uniref:MYB domain class transcription factor n=1 Tax=Solanum tuberosum TaxID=4113 RepID=M1CPY6_SOLTU
MENKFKDEEEGLVDLIGIKETNHNNNNNINGGTKLCSRGHWRPHEDAKLKELVGQYGPQNWNLIAEKLEGRSGLSRDEEEVKMGLYGNMSDTNSEISASESVANNMTNIVKIYEDEDDVKTVNFIDFLGVGAT